METTSSIHRLIGSVKRYLHLQRDFVMLTLAGGIVLMLAALVLIFASLAVGAQLGEWTGSLALGYGIVAVFYLIVGVIVWLNRKRWIANPIAGFLATLLVDDETKK
ncbi:MAG: hypothetical protein Q4E49_07770 [Bacteroidales bacterium]|nr:hypothetical protein [Bacteroidales bacterium]